MMRAASSRCGLTGTFSSVNGGATDEGVAMSRHGFTGLDLTMNLACSREPMRQIEPFIWQKFSGNPADTSAMKPLGNATDFGHGLRDNRSAGRDRRHHSFVLYSSGVARGMGQSRDFAGCPDWHLGHRQMGQRKAHGD